MIEEEQQLYKPISADSILKKLKYKCNYITYDVLPQVSDIMEILNPYNKCLILILTESPTLGHFVCLYCNEKQTDIYFFDSYGYMIDDQLQYVKPMYKKQFNSDYRYLTELLVKKCNKRIHYNEFPLQGQMYDTCGYWCFVRLFYDEISVEDFYKIFKQYRNPDLIVILIFNSF